jgi:hypothetical protein
VTLQLANTSLVLSAMTPTTAAAPNANMPPPTLSVVPAQVAVTLPKNALETQVPAPKTNTKTMENHVATKAKASAVPAANVPAVTTSVEQS